jgi:hypothetical protein
MCIFNVFRVQSSSSVLGFTYFTELKNQGSILKCFEFKLGTFRLYWGDENSVLAQKQEGLKAVENPSGTQNHQNHIQRTMVDGCQKGFFRAPIQKVKIPSSLTHSSTTSIKFLHHSHLFQIFCVLRGVGCQHT